MKPRWHSCESAQLDTDHGEVNPSLGAGVGALVVPHQTSVAHQPAQRSLYNPSPRKHDKARQIIGALHDLHFNFRPMLFHPASKRFAGITAIDPKSTQTRKPIRNSAQDGLRTVPLRATSRGHRHTEQQPKRIHQQVPLAPLFSPDRSGWVPPLLAPKAP